MIQQNYSLRKRQFRNLSKQINGLVKSQKWQELSQEQQSRLAGRFHKLFGQIRSFFTRRELKKVLAGAAMLIGLSGAVQAQDFAAPVQNAFSLMPVVDLAIPNLVDIDGDGDLDMFISEYGDYTPPALVFFSNDGTPTDPIFGKPVKNPFNFSTTAYQYIFPTFADMDDDGDFDMLGLGITGYYQLDFFYYENVGSATAPDFAAVQLNPFSLQTSVTLAVNPQLVDMDNDGDYDLLVGGQYYDAVNEAYLGVLSYYENTGTAAAPDFGSIQSNPFGLGMTNTWAFPTVADLDNDGDFDILVGEYYGALQYFENTGTDTAPAFAAAQANPFGLTSPVELGFPTFGDIDNDGDLDLFVGEYYGNTQFFENLAIEVAVQNPEKESALQIFPNPASKQITIDLEGQYDNIHLSIINELGMEVKQQVLSNGQRTLNIEDLPTGFYMVELKTEKEQMVKKLIIK